MWSEEWGVVYIVFDNQIELYSFFDLKTTKNLLSISKNEKGKIIIGGDSYGLFGLDSDLFTFEIIKSSNDFPESFFSILFLNDSLICAGVIKDLNLLHCYSSDGGKNWIYSNLDVASSVPVHYFHLFKNTIMICGNYGTILKADTSDLSFDKLDQFGTQVTKGPYEFKIRISNFSGNSHKKKLIANSTTYIFTTNQPEINNWDTVYSNNYQMYQIRDAKIYDNNRVLALIDSSYYVQDKIKYKIKLLSIENNKIVELVNTIDDLKFNTIVCNSDFNYISINNIKRIILSTNSGLDFKEKSIEKCK